MGEEKEIIVIEKNNEEYKDILLELSSCDFENLDEKTAKPNILDKIDKRYFPYHAQGSTKLVLFIAGNYDFVVKIPFSYDYESGYYLKHNYCHLEESIYKSAVKAGLEDMFAKPTLIGLINDHPIYIQEMVEILNSLDEEEYPIISTKKSKDFAETLILTNREVDDIDDRWLATAVEYYGEELCINLMDFMKENNVYDLHEGNVGYLNGRPVLVDYSGYDG